MSKSALSVAILAVALATTTACTERGERRVRDRWRAITGEPRDVAQRVDLNTASERELAKLPGLTDDDAGRIIANRPYGDKRGLLRKNVIGEGKYEKIEDYVFASQPRRQGDRD
jgi:hypothetical protein